MIVTRVSLNLNSETIALKREVVVHVSQAEHDDLEAKFNELERAALEAKYQKLYEPLYVKVCSFSVCF